MRLQDIPLLIYDRRVADKYRALLREAGCLSPITVATTEAELLAALPQAEILIGTSGGLLK